MPENESVVLLRVNVAGLDATVVGDLLQLAMNSMASLLIAMAESIIAVTRLRVSYRTCSEGSCIPFVRPTSPSSRAHL